MDKRTAIKRLHAMIDTRMFGESSWLADRDACISIHEQLKHLELEFETDELTKMIGPFGNGLVRGIC